MTDLLHTLRAFYTKNDYANNIWYNGSYYECGSCGKKATEIEILTELPCEGRDTHKNLNFEVKHMSGWETFLYNQLGNLFWAIVPLIVGIIIEKWLNISLVIEKFFNRYSTCNFEFVCELKGDNNKIKSAIETTLKARGYKVSYDEKGYRTLLTARKEDLESIKFRMIEEDTLHVSLDAPIQTIVKSVSSRLSELTAILQDAKDKSKAEVELASLQVSLPYKPMHKVKPPKGMKITDYKVEMLDKKKVKVLITLNNTLQVSSTNFIDLTEAYRSIV
jgi:hypothetical protein